MTSRIVTEVRIYSAFRVQRVRNLRLEIYKLTKKCTVNYLLSDGFSTERQSWEKRLLESKSRYVVTVIYCKGLSKKSRRRRKIVCTSRSEERQTHGE